MKECYRKIDFTRKPIIMGILNVTPDSFSDGGEFVDIDKALQRAIKMADEGAKIIDIGPESSRPGSLRVSAQQQIDRAAPLIEKILSVREIPISIDTYDSTVAKACLDAGAAIVNDITAGSDPEMFSLCAKRNIPIVLMHMQGTPENMQDSPAYSDVVEEVLGYLLDRAATAQEAGVAKGNIILDPGIGFGKTLQHNLELMRALEKFANSDYLTLLGASRKRFIGELTNQNNPSNRCAGTIATTLAAMSAGIDIVRVHDVRATSDALAVARAIY